MSVHVISWVLRHSPTKLGQRLVLIVLADHADADGGSAYPAVETIARQARMSERNARYALRHLEAAGAIRAEGRSSTGTRVYRVVMGANLAPADFAPEPSSMTGRGQNAAPPGRSRAAARRAAIRRGEVDGC